MPPSRAQNGPNENLTGVMDRFQAWTNAQPSGSSAASPAEGVREVTYAEALAAQRLRRSQRPGIPQHIAQDVALDATHDLASLLSPRKPAAIEAEPVRAPVSTLGSVIIEPEKHAPAAQNSAAARKQTTAPRAIRKTKTLMTPAFVTAPASASSTSSRNRKPALPKENASESLRRTAGLKPVANPDSQRSRSTTRTSERRTVAASSTASRKTGRAALSQPVPTDFKTAFMKSLNKTADTTKATSASGKRSTARDLIVAGKVPVTSSAKTTTGRNAIAPPMKAKSQPLVEASIASRGPKRASVLRSISINLRLSNAEHFQLRARAAAANQPMAVYVRDCALRTLAPPAENLKNSEERMPLPALAHTVHVAEKVIPPPRSISEMASDYLLRFRTFWLGSRLEVTV